MNLAQMIADTPAGGTLHIPSGTIFEMPALRWVVFGFKKGRSPRRLGVAKNRSREQYRLELFFQYRGQRKLMKP